MAETEPKPSFRLAEQAKAAVPFLSFGLFAATLPFLPPQLSYVSGLLVERAAGDASALAAFLGVLLGTLLGLVSLRKESPRLELSRTPLLMVAAAYLASIGILALSAGLPSWTGLLLRSIASFIATAAALRLVLVWLHLFMGLTLLEAASYLCLSALLGAAVNFLAVAHLVPYTTLIALLLAAGGVAGPLAHLQGEGREGQARPAALAGEPDQCSSEPLAHSMLPTVIAMLFGLFLEILAMSARVAAYADRTMPLAYQYYEALAPLAAGLILLCFLRTRHKLDIAEIAYFYIPFCSVLFFVLSAFIAESPLFDFGFLGSNTLLVVIGLLALDALAGVARAGELPPTLIGAIAFAGCSLASCLGFELPRVVGTTPLGPLLLILATAYFVVIISIALVHQRRLIRSLEAESGPTSNDGQPLQRGQRLDEIAHVYHLTQREREILEYLASGHNSPFIAEHLFISEYTVRTHMRNTYRKIGVGTKEELITFLESYHSSN
ncbi:MAG: helix-turn-helix transcriptional regulator [Adlercreutzia sp.]|nr:helix-turn-helix transcriptional regulator [Adlercreutzia sp.]